MKKSITILSFLLSVVAFGQTNLTELYRMAYSDFRAANFEEAIKLDSTDMASFIDRGMC